MTFWQKMQEGWRKKGAAAAVLLAVIAIAGSMLLPTEEAAPDLPGARAVSTGEGAAYASQLEARLGEVLSQMEGAGHVEVVIQYAQEADGASATWTGGAQQENTAGAVAVIVVAEGADDVQVRLQLARAVETLLQLDAEAVEVFQMRKEE